MTVHNVSRCPKCYSPAFTDIFKKMLEIDPKCPMCFAAVEPDMVDTDIGNPQSFLREKVIDSEKSEK